MKEKEDIKELRETILKGMKVSSKKMIKEKIRLGQTIVISENGIVKEVDPKELEKE